MQYACLHCFLLYNLCEIVYERKVDDMPILRRLSIILMAAVLLAGCTSDAISEETDSVQATSEVQQPTESQDGATTGADEPPGLVEETIEEPNLCMECHGNPQRLTETADPAVDVQLVSYWSQLEPLDPWEKVFVDSERIQETVHGFIPCNDCHGGQQSMEKMVAHDGLVKRPSQGNPNVCSGCHSDIAEIYSNSLHASLEGFKTSLEARSTPDGHPALDEMYSENCSSCHTACGDCHVSRPDSAGGGLFAGHRFLRTPPMVESCTACHGSTVGKEYLGMHEDYPADVHLRNGNMECVDCHTSAQLHGQPANCSECHTSPPGATIPPLDHRYAGIQSPSCLSCHANISIAESDIPIHQVHGAQLACQVCHSIAYTSCEGCHLSTSGYPNYELEDSYLTFVLGLNPQRTFTRPYKYVPLRHAPVTADMYSAYGEDLLSNFDLLPTWTYTTPHNIQRYTFQAAGCNYCHSNSDIFLTEDKVNPDEVEANRSVIVPQVPATAGGETLNIEESQSESSP
jgi:hypothetical protein